MNYSDDSILYSTDPSRMPQAKKSSPPSGPLPKPNQIRPLVRIEKKGRGGKTVTIIERLPRNIAFLKHWGKLIKSHCGCGGTEKITSEQGILEIQGEKPKEISQFLFRSGFLIKEQ